MHGHIVMMITYLNQKKLIPQEITTDNQALLQEALWIDLICPSKTEEALAEQYFDLEIPTREEMREIELSSRLYKENDTLFMTATMLAHSDSPESSQYDAVTFILTKSQLITIRYIEPLAFKLFISRLQKMSPVSVPHQATALFIDLLDATTDRLADILEAVGRRLDECSKTIFLPQQTPQSLDYQQFMQQIGSNGDVNAKVRESLMMFNRLITFFGQTASPRVNDEEQLRLTTLSKDILALSDHASFLSNKVNFLLDATLGMVSIDQNKIIKIFSVAAVIFLPPTLIASIYGMNFKFMPELSWHWGYSIAIALMLLSAWLPYKYFKRRKWL